MSEEDNDLSFEILGTTPTPSYMDYSMTSSINCGPATFIHNTDDAEPYKTDDKSLQEMTSSHSMTKKTNTSPNQSMFRSCESNKENSKDFAMQILLRNKPNTESLPLLGSLNSEFPSLAKSHLTDSDFNKLKTVVEEHNQLKENLIRANQVIKQYFSTVEQWQNDVRGAKERDRRSIEYLTKSNEGLKGELETMAHLLQAKNDEMMILSDKLSIQIEKSQKIELEKKSESNRLETEQMFTRDQYKTVERQLSQVVAENFQFKDMEEGWKDEINGLKVKLTSMEELLENNKTQLSVERNKYRELEMKTASLVEDNQVLIQQAQIYKKDFEDERTARQNLAKEKDELLVELIQIRGQGSDEHKYTCPFCYSRYPKLDLLQTHIQTCNI